VALEQGLEFVRVRRIDHVQHRQPSRSSKLVVAEGFQIGLVGAHMHAFVHIGNRIGGGIEQRIAAALRFAQRGFQPAHLATCLQRVEFALQYGNQLLRLAARRDATGAADEQVGDSWLSIVLTRPSSE
jgi:hypothetical protein